jgi:hypothetical protein
MMHPQVIHDRVDALGVGWDLLVELAEEVHKMHGAAARLAGGPAVPSGFPQGPIHVALGSAPIIDLLLGSLGGTGIDLNGLLPGIALGGQRSHLINV